MLKHLLATTFLISFATTPALAATIFNQSYTGADIFNDPTASFPTRTPILDGSSLRFGTGTGQQEKLVELPLIPAGTISPNAITTVTYTINLTRLTGDSDNQFGLIDGSGSHVTFAVQDHVGGIGSTKTGVDNGQNIGISTSDLLFTGAGFPSIGGDLDATGSFTLSNTGTDVSLEFGSGSGERTETQVLNPAGALSFIYWTSEAPEQYQLNTLSVQIEVTNVPEPIGILGMITVSGFGFAMKKKQS